MIVLRTPQHRMDRNSLILVDIDKLVVFCFFYRQVSMASTNCNYSYEENKGASNTSLTEKGGIGVGLWTVI